MKNDISWCSLLRTPLEHTDLVLLANGVAVVITVAIVNTDVAQTAIWILLAGYYDEAPTVIRYTTINLF